MKQIKCDAGKSWEDESYFPILIEWSDTNEREVVIHPKFITSGRAFRVIETKVKQGA